MSDGAWVSLFSGGKDSSWALYRAGETGRDVTHLVTVHPGEDSYLYHVPATHLAGLAAESIGLPLVEVDAEVPVPDGADSGRQGDRELEPLESTLTELAAAHDLEGFTAGAVESRFQRDRLLDMGERLGLELYAPLWQGDPFDLLADMLDAGFEIVVIAVAAAGLDEGWLGRTIGREAMADLRRLHEAVGVHPLGEGGEFETLVVDGPHMARRIELVGDPVWQGNRGRLRVTDAHLA